MNDTSAVIDGEKLKERVNEFDDELEYLIRRSLQQRNDIRELNKELEKLKSDIAEE